VISSWFDDGIPAAGLYLGAFAWLVSTVANYALAPWACSWEAPWLIPAIAMALTGISLVGGLLSWRAWTRPEPVSEDRSVLARPRRLLAGLATFNAALFAIIIGLQGTAGLILRGCER
jgi:hypothetical protein